MTALLITPLKRINHIKGDIYHAIKATDPGYAGFGEAYFTTVHRGEVKGWKKHLRMTMNLIVVQGNVRFFIKASDADAAISITAGESNYVRITVPPKHWVAFEGIGTHLNLVLNVADLPHDPAEAENLPLERFDLGGHS